MAFYCYGKQGICNCDILCADCKFYDDKGGKEVQTNAERIRAMSDEELARWVLQFVMDSFSASGFENPKWEDGAEEDMIKWLKQPAETTPITADTCVCCGAIIPEGQMVCPNCLQI